MPVTPKLIPLQIDQGAKFRQTFLYEDENGDPVDMTGYEGQMQLRYKVTDDAPAATFRTDGAPVEAGDEPTGTLELSSDGIVVIEMAEDVTVLIAAPRTYEYDLFVIPPDDAAVKLAYGPVPVTARVTRPNS